MTSSLSQKSRLALFLRALLYSFQSLWRWVVKVLFIVFTPNLLDLNILPPSERFRLFQKYVTRWHGQTPEEVSEREFRASLGSTCLDTRCLEFRLGDTLLAVGIFDLEENSVSAVYCYYDPDEQQRSLGTYNILRLIDLAQRLGKPWVYLGYYVEPCRAMRYKIRFRPCEIRQPDGTWRRVD
jgi:arginyl-tRNA--protein-N-Asp/Glu arginylyltransferase